jgi:nucleoside-diphosphate-sugar epimerase
MTVLGALDEAVSGVDAIAHVASPVSFSFTDPEPVMSAAIHGTTGILESAVKQPSVEHFVLMSSIVAILTPKDNHVFTEADWNTVPEDILEKDGKDAGSYIIYAASKTASERALWKVRNGRNPEVHRDGFGPCVSTTSLI